MFKDLAFKNANETSILYAGAFLSPASSSIFTPYFFHFNHQNLDAETAVGEKGRYSDQLVEEVEDMTFLRRLPSTRCLSADLARKAKFAEDLDVLGRNSGALLNREEPNQSS